MPTISELVVKIIADTAGLDKGIDKANASLKSVGDTTQTAQTKTQKLTGEFFNMKTLMAGALVGAFIGVSKAIYETTKAFADAEISASRLNLVAKMNGVRNGSDEIQDLGVEIQKLTGISNDLVNQLGSELLAQGKSLNQTKDLIQAATELSAITGDDLSTSVKALANTYSGMAGTIGRSIPAIKGLTKEQLENGDAITLINSKYKGYSDQLSGTTLVSQNRFKENMGDMAELIGSVFAPALSAMRDVLSDSMETLAKAAKGFETTGKVLKIVSIAIATIVAPLYGIPAAWKAITGALGKHNAEALKAAQATADQSVALDQYWKSLKDTTGQLIKMTDAQVLSRKESIEQKLEYGTLTAAIRKKYEDQLALINKEIKARKDEAQALKDKEKAEADALNTAERNKKIREDGLKLAQSTIEANKTEIQKIRDKISELTALTGLTKIENEQRTQAILLLNQQASELTAVSYATDGEAESIEKVDEAIQEATGNFSIFGDTINEEVIKSLRDMSSAALQVLNAMDASVEKTFSNLVDLAADAAIKSKEPTIVAIGAAVKVVKAGLELLTGFVDEQKRQMDAFEANMDSVQSDILSNKIAAAKAANDKILQDTIDRLDSELKESDKYYDTTIGNAKKTYNAQSETIKRVESEQEKSNKRLIADNKKVTDQKLIALDKELQAALKAIGMQDLTDKEEAEKKLAEAKASGDAEKIAEAEKQLAKQTIIEQFEAKKQAVLEASQKRQEELQEANILRQELNDANNLKRQEAHDLRMEALEKAKQVKQDEIDKKKEAAQLAAAKATSKLAYDKAVLDQKIAVAQAKIQEQKAIADLGWGNKKEKADIKTMYAELVASIQSIPLPAYARGTDFARGGLSRINEEGGEIVNVPRGSSVIPATRTPVSGGNSGMTVIINSPVKLTPSEAASVWKQTAKDMAFRGAV